MKKYSSPGVTPKKGDKVADRLEIRLVMTIVGFHCPERAIYEDAYHKR